MLLSREEFYRDFATVEAAERAVEGFERMGIRPEALAPVKARIALERVTEALRPIFMGD